MTNEAPNHIFVTGGSGFLGRRLVQRLVADGCRVSALARSAATAKALAGLGATIVEGDLASIDQWRHHLAGVNGIVHSAAYLKFGDARRRFEQINVEATRHLLEAARSASVECFVFVSAASVVMQEPAAMEAVTEVAPLTQTTWLPYSSTKADAERLVLAAASETPALRTVAVRPPFIWGKGDAFDHELGALVRAGRFAYFDGGKFPYSVCHVDNACEAVVNALMRGQSGHAYFVADREVTTAKDFFDQRIAALGNL
jgi:nucleoside-diphosphate-sugar epimerase